VVLLTPVVGWVGRRGFFSRLVARAPPPPPQDCGESPELILRLNRKAFFFFSLKNLICFYMRACAVTWRIERFCFLRICDDFSALSL